ncbi:MAG: ABC transporter ATP-binding protein [Elusimicrobia bacterium]|nr:ABC transporter ATP-binding protein [Elusimicrobiota bacterium]
MSQRPLLEVSELAVVYGRKIEALKGVSLSVFPGEIAALIGNNGAGKTTLLRAVAGQLKPERGSIRLDGAEIRGLASHRVMRLGISLVPEGRRIFPRLTVRENLEMGAYARPDRDLGRDYARVFELFPLLEKRASQLAGTLSGGEQQMLAMGRALMSRPRLLILDEPSMGLAPVIVDRVFDAIARISQEGMTILLVEQNARRALKAARRAYVLETGRIALSGAAEALLNDPSVKETYLGLK